MDLFNLVAAAVLGRASFGPRLLPRRVARIALYSEGVLLRELGRIRTLVRIRISTTGRVTILADGRLQNAAEPRKLPLCFQLFSLLIMVHGMLLLWIVFQTSVGHCGRAIDYLDANFDRFP